MNLNKKIIVINWSFNIKNYRLNNMEIDFLDNELKRALK